MILLTAGAVYVVIILLALGPGAPALEYVNRDLISHYGDHNIVFDYLTGWGWALILGLVLMFLPVQLRVRKVLVGLWGVKIFLCLILMLYYESYYHLDATFYFIDAHHLDLIDSPLTFANRNDIMIGLQRIQNMFIIPDSYHAFKITSAFAGLLATLVFYGAWRFITEKEDVNGLIVLTLVPSILFWSSIYGKDPFCLLGIAGFAYGLLGWYRTRQPWYVVPLVAGAWLFSWIRPWLIVCFGATVPFLAFRRRTPLANLVAIVFLVGGLSLVQPALASLTDSFAVRSVDDVGQAAGRQLRNYTLGSSANTGFQIRSISGYLLFLPIGIFTALFRPLPGEILNIFGTLAGCENLLLLTYFCRSLRLLYQRKAPVDPVIVWMLLTMLIWAAMHGLLSVGNLGAGIRYRLEIMPFLIGFIAYIHQKAGVPLYNIRTSPGQPGPASLNSGSLSGAATAR